MARVGNSFALLLDEEGDDMTVLVEHIAKKVELSTPLPATALETKHGGKNQQSQPADGMAPALVKSQGKSFLPAENVRGDRGPTRGGEGRGYKRSGYGGNDADQFGNGRENGYRRNYYNGDSDGNGFNDGSFRGRVRGRGGGRGRGRGRQGRAYNDNGFPNEKVADGGEEKQVGDSGDAGWENVPPSHAKVYRNERRPMDDQRTYKNESQSYGDDRGDGHQNYGGERNGGYQNYDSDRRRAPRVRRDGMNPRMDEPSDNVEIKEADNGGDEETKDENNNGDSEEKNEAGFFEVAKDTETEDKKAEEVTKEDDAAKNDEKKKEEEEGNYMTLDEYEKLLSEKRKALEALKGEERKVNLDKDFEAMQLVEKKKEESTFVKLRSDKEKLKRRENVDKEEKARKSVSINEFLKPAEGEEAAFSRRAGGRGRGRGRGRGEQHGGFGYRNGGERQQRGGGGFKNNGKEGGDVYGEQRVGGGYGRERRVYDAPAISIEDPGQFPVLGGAAVKA